ncbi:DUF2268 domain-containing putative Zn-dependent protease [Lysobacter sp. LF1]|uniref:DUF2268 domain-containing putative Zn-dependent protease n=1 Tax=Lysobacter stagni TaxID=3045172 RepID=A0ABT6XIE0_9GAMM|nr:DUF2268 domain-containing putative Zn-dependent protease [Lysobacter sp. LF1]MDI9239555.1 DUF2268 domain-containing putative Zn-dependent protease [Lysobacter sp. LF1]
MLRLRHFAPLVVFCLVPVCAQAAPPGPQILTEDVTRFYAMYDATAGKPTVEQIEQDYLARGTPSLHEFAKLRRVTAQSIADRMARDPAIYANAKQCMTTLPAVEKRLTAAFARLAQVYPEAKFPPVAIVVGRGKPVGMAYPGGLTIGLEALCAADFMNPDIEDRFVHVIAHEYGHIQQTGATDFEDGDPRATVLRVSLIEGGAEFISELISGNVGNPGLADRVRGHEREIETRFARDIDSTDLTPWLYNYQAGTDAPYDQGYWIGYRIAKSYYLQAKERGAAVRDILQLDDPKAFLAKSGWTPGMTLPPPGEGID